MRRSSTATARPSGAWTLKRRRRLGDVWATSGRRLGDVWATSGRRLGDAWALKGPFGGHPSAPYPTFPAYNRSCYAGGGGPLIFLRARKFCGPYGSPSRVRGAQRCGAASGGGPAFPQHPVWGAGQHPHGRWRRGVLRRALDRGRPGPTWKIPALDPFLACWLFFAILTAAATLRRPAWTLKRRLDT